MATVKKRKKSYLFRVYDGYDIKGKQVERTKTWHPPLGMTEKQADKEADLQAALFEDQVRTGTAANGKIRFSNFADLWFRLYAEKKLRPRTVSGYRDLLKRVNLVFGNMRLERIRPTQVLEFYAELEESEAKNATYRMAVNLENYFSRRRGQTKTAFAKKNGISLTTLDTALKGRPISRDSAEKICNGLNLSFQNTFIPTSEKKILSASTVQHYHHLLSSILGTAVRWQYIPYNPCTHTTPPKNKSPEIAYLDDEQALHLVKLLRSEEGFYRRTALLLLLTGLRRGELLGLEWQDIDWEAKTLFISRTSQYLPKNGLITGEPKTKCSKRIVYLPDQAITVLREQLLWQKRQALALGSAWQASPRIFTSPDGSPLQPDRLTKWFSKFVRKTDLPPIHIHSLRHTYATLCIAKGVPLTAVSAQLGHASVSTTANIYAHAIKSAQLVAVDAFGRLFADAIKITDK